MGVDLVGVGGSRFIGCEVFFFVSGAERRVICICLLVGSDRCG